MPTDITPSTAEAVPARASPHRPALVAIRAAAWSALAVVASAAQAVRDAKAARGRRAAGLLAAALIVGGASPSPALARDLRPGEPHVARLGDLSAVVLFTVEPGGDLRVVATLSVAEPPFDDADASRHPPPAAPTRATATLRPGQALVLSAPLPGLGRAPRELVLERVGEEHRLALRDRRVEASAVPTRPR